MSEPPLDRMSRAIASSFSCSSRRVRSWRCPAPALSAAAAALRTPTRFSPRTTVSPPSRSTVSARRFLKARVWSSRTSWSWRSTVSMVPGTRSAGEHRRGRVPSALVLCSGDDESALVIIASCAVREGPLTETCGALLHTYHRGVVAGAHSFCGGRSRRRSGGDSGFAAVVSTFAKRRLDLRTATMCCWWYTSARIREVPVALGGCPGARASRAPGGAWQVHQVTTRLSSSAGRELLCRICLDSPTDSLGIFWSAGRQLPARAAHLQRASSFMVG